MGCSTARASQRGRRTRARAMGARDDASFMRWLGDATNDASLVDKIEIQERAKTFGTRGVAAVRDLAPGETLLRVPWRLVSESSADADADADGRDAWSTSMGMEILEELYGGDDDGRRTWLMRLPKPAPATPPLHFDDDELAAIEDDAVEAEARAVREAHERAVDGCSDRLEAIGKTREDLRWATAVVHSRVFTRRDPSAKRATRLLVPGVDMFNHDSERYNCIVRVVTSPDTCQGAQATDEIAPSMSTSTRDEEKYFELVVDPDGETIEAGDELLISYGSFPNDVWLLYFGFIPRDTNPNDTFALFPEGVDDLVRHVVDAGFLASVSDERIRALRECLDDDGRRPITCTIDSVDGALIHACDAVLGVPWMDVVASRCKAILLGDRFSTKIKDDVAILRDDAISSRTKLAVEFRLRKKSILLAPLGQTLAKYGFDA